MTLFLRGFTIGLAIAAPVGPIGVMCIRRTLAYGWLSGFISGLGAATADALYGSLAAFGLTLITERLVAAQDGLSLAGGLFLVYLGIRTLDERPKLIDPAAATRPVAGGASVIGLAAGVDFVSTFLLTLTNPITILSFAAIYAGLGVANAGQTVTPAAALPVVAGVYAGSASWWLFLCAAVSGLQARFIKPGWAVWVGRVSGLVILAFGVAALTSLLSGYL